MNWRQEHVPPDVLQVCKAFSRICDTHLGYINQCHMVLKTPRSQEAMVDKLRLLNYEQGFCRGR